jgi:hypothetical protein
VVQNALLHYLRSLVQGERRDEIIDKVRDSVAVIAGLEEPYRGQVIQSYGSALRLAFACSAAVAFLSFCLLITVRPPRLRATASAKTS